MNEKSNIPHLYAWYFSSSYVESYEHLIDIIGPNLASNTPLEVIVNILTNLDPMTLPQTSNPRDFLTVEQNRDLDELMYFRRGLDNYYFHLADFLYEYEREDYAAETDEEESVVEDTREEFQHLTLRSGKRQKLSRKAKTNKVISEKWAYCLVRDPETPNIFPFLPFELRNNPNILRNAILRWKANAAWSQLENGNEAYFPEMEGYRRVYVCRLRDYEGPHYSKMILVPAYKSLDTHRCYTFAEFYLLTGYYNKYGTLDFIDNGNEGELLKADQFDPNIGFTDESIDELNVKKGRLFERLEFDSEDADDEELVIDLYSPDNRPLYQFYAVNDMTGRSVTFPVDKLVGLVREVNGERWMERWSDEEKNMNELVNITGFSRSELQKAITKLQSNR